MAGYLVVAPHIDDEVLGCGGILDERFHVHYCGVEEFRIISREARLEEAKFTVNLENIVNRYVQADLIGQLEELINRIRPITVFLPYPSYNQDHRVVLDAALVAMRPHDVNFRVKNALLYEEIQVGVWPYREDILHGQTYHPNCHFPVDIRRKIQAYRLHASQVRGMRSPEMLEELAKWRGFQSGHEFAESFMAIKLSDPTQLDLGKLKR